MLQRIALLLVSVGLLAGVAACSTTEQRPVAEHLRDTLSARVEPNIIEETIERHDNGLVRVGRLNGPMEVNGIECRDWIQFHSDGTVRACELSSRTTIQGDRMPSGSQLWFNADGRLESCWLGDSIRLQGVPCRGGSGKVATGFYPNGRLRSAFISETTVLQGIPCQATLFTPVRFHDDGRLAGCKLSAEVTIKGRTFAPGTVIWIDREGRATEDR